MKDYKQLSAESAENKMNDIKTLLKSIINANATSLSKAELAYFQQISQRCI
jgi:hypothetical protein